jgi:5-methylcytosine-specific restriction enzyme A
MARNPAWHYDELVLALDIYVHAPRARIDKNDPAIGELSEILRALPLHLDRPDPARFRNTNSVYLKLQNFKTVDPDYPGAGMRRGAGPREQRVWDRFAGNPDELAAAAGAIRKVAAEPGLLALDEPEDGGVVEGRLLLRWHRTRERKRGAEKKRAVLRDTGRLACEVCDFDFAAAYGELGAGFAECHHKLPLTAGVRRTQLADLAIVCANCHRMLHRRSPWLTVEELRGVIAAAADVERSVKPPSPITNVGRR